MAATRGSSRLRTATPVAGSDATSSLFARATPSRSPKNSTCAMATLVTMPTSGRATRARRSMWPDPAGAHLEHDPARVVGRVQERQREPELVVEGALARRSGKCRGETAVEEVLGGGLAHGAGDPHHTPDPGARQHAEVHQRSGGVGNDHGRSPCGLAHRQVGGRPGLEGGADELVPVALGDDRDVELARPDGPGVDAGPVDGDIGPDQLAAELGCELRCGESHASPSWPIV